MFSILFGAILTVAVCVALGKLFVNSISLRLPRLDHYLFSFLIGAALLNLAVFGLAAIEQARNGAFLTLGLVAMAAAVKWGGPPGPLGASRTRERQAVLCWLAIAIFALYFSLYFWNALAPETSPDGAEYHLGNVAHYWRHHGFLRLPNAFYASLSQAMEMLYLYAFSFGRHSAAAMVHFVFLLTLPLLMWSYARRAGFERAGIFAALVVFVSPMFGVDGTSAYNDVAAACVLFGVFCLLQIWDETRQPALLPAIGVLAGFGYALKYTAFLGVVYAALFVWRGRRRMIRPAAVVCAWAALLILPWLAKNWILAANPLAPFFNRLFPNPYIHIAFENEYYTYMRHFSGIHNPARLALDWTVIGDHAGGVLGPVFLLAPLGLLALRRTAGRHLLLAGALFALPVFTNDGTRFLIPAAPYFALAMGLAFANSWGVLPVLLAAHAVASWPTVMPAYANRDTWRPQMVSRAVARRRVPEKDYLESRGPNYQLARAIEELVPPNGVVFTYSGLPEAYTSRPIVVWYESAFGERMRDVLYTPILWEFAPNLRLWFRFAEQPVRRLRVVRSGGEGDYWSLSEVRILDGPHELSRDPRWRLRAHPNPWEVQLAFDNSLLTRWRTWQPVFSGMFVEVEFPKPETVDSVMVDCSTDQVVVEMRLDGQLPGGSWRTLAAKPQRVDPPPETNLRRAAIQELEAHGITHMVIRDSDLGAADFQQHASVWGITELRHYGDARLYRLD